MRVLRIAAVAVLLAAGVVARLMISDAPASSPTIETGPAAIACVTATRCLTVGFSGSSYGVRMPFGAALDGGSWSATMPPPPPRVIDALLLSVACGSIDDCVGVGGQDVPAPSLGARSAGERPLIYTWDGSAWVQDIAPIPPGTSDARLNGVSCADTICMAVGRSGRNRERQLATLWDGRRWSLRLPSPLRRADDASLEAVDCVSAASCTAVGQFGYELQELVGGVAPLIQRWDGSMWRPEASANPQDSLDTELNGVACPTQEMCMAVGFQRLPGGAYASFAEVREGGGWRVVPIPDPPNSPDVELADVACTAPDRCVAVGSWLSGGSVRGLILTWDGARWASEAGPAPPGATSTALTAVDCPSPAACIAVGTSEHGSPTQHPFSLIRSDGRWMIIPVPEPDASSLQGSGGAFQSITASSAPSSTT